MKPELITTLITAALLSGCATHVDRDITNERSSFGTALLGTVFEIVSDSRDIRQCTKHKTSRRVSTSEASASCSKQLRQRKLAEQREERRENLERKEALQQSFNNRSETLDTAAVIEKQRTSGSWLTQSEEKQTSVVIQNTPGQFD